MADSAARAEQLERLEHRVMGDHENSHEMRISRNERWRLRMEGGVTVIAFAVGGGALTTGLLWVLGIL